MKHQYPELFTRYKLNPTLTAVLRRGEYEQTLPPAVFAPFWNGLSDTNKPKKSS